MFDYSQSKDQTGLEPWPPLTDIGAEILSGNPSASGRLDFGTLSTSITVGVWECTKGSFRVAYPWNEVCTFTEGSVTITDENGQSVTFKAGDSHFVVKGETLTWEIHSPVVKKSFAIYWEDQRERDK